MERGKLYSEKTSVLKDRALSAAELMNDSSPPGFFEGKKKEKKTANENKLNCAI